MAVKNSQSRNPLPRAVEEACVALGERLSIARRRRRMTQQELGRRAGLSTFTISRIENGVATTELSSIVRVLWALGLEGSMTHVAASEGDVAAETMDRARLPKRIRNEGLDDDF